MGDALTTRGSGQHGAVAQMGERRFRTAEARGSIPRSSTRGKWGWEPENSQPPEPTGTRIGVEYLQGNPHLRKRKGSENLHHYRYSSAAFRYSWVMEVIDRRGQQGPSPGQLLDRLAHMANCLGYHVGCPHARNVQSALEQGREIQDRYLPGRIILGLPEAERALLKELTSDMVRGKVFWLPEL